MSEGMGTSPVRPPVDLRKTATPLGAELPGYGLTPRSAKERAAVVRAVTKDEQIRQRPMPVVAITASVALVGLVVFGWQLYSFLTADPGAGEPPAAPSTALWIGLVTFLVASAICSWAWQLYDVKKAIVMWLAIAALSVVAVVVIAVVLAALKGDGDGLDIDLDELIGKITGGAARTTGNVVNNVVIPVAADTLDAAANGGFDNVTWGGDGAEAATASAEPPAQQAAPGEPACPSCGRALTPGLLVCPRCGSRLDSVL
jgi:hypothetical protein